MSIDFHRIFFSRLGKWYIVISSISLVTFIFIIWARQQCVQIPNWFEDNCFLYRIQYDFYAYRIVLPLWIFCTIAFCVYIIFTLPDKKNNNFPPQR